jgi:hypothetical protein
MKQIKKSGYFEFESVIICKKVKGKVLHWGTSAFCALTPKEFLHSSLEALHTERYTAPQLAKEGTK